MQTMNDVDKFQTYELCRDLQTENQLCRELELDDDLYRELLQNYELYIELQTR